MMTLEERLNMAAEYRKMGYNCAGSVLACFGDVTGLDEKSALRITASLGTGIGGTREICGAATAMSMVAGSQLPPEPLQKGIAAKRARRLLEEFANSNKGCLRCAQLKDRQNMEGDVRSCNELVAQCVELAHNGLED